MNNSDRFIVSRAEGYDPKLIWSLSQEQRSEAQKPDSYQGALFGALFNRVLPPNVQLSSWLPPVEEEVRKENGQRALRQFKQAIPTTPSVTLDLPDVSNDYYTHSVAVWGKNAAVVLGRSCYVVSDIASRAREVKVVLERAVGAYRLTCVEWINATTLAIGCLLSSTLYVVDVTGSRALKSQKGLQHIALGQITRITRLTDDVFLTGYSNGEVVYNNVTTEESYSLVGMRRRAETVCSIVPSKNNALVAIGYDDGAVDLHELTSQKTFRFVRSFISSVATGKRALAWFPGNIKLFISGGGKGAPVLCVYDCGQDEPITSFHLPAAVTNIVFTDRNRFIATYGNTIGYFTYKNRSIIRIQAVPAATDARLLDAVYSREAGLLTSSAAEFLNVWPPVHAQLPQKQKSQLNLVTIR